jgi:hypothetical protein
MSLLLAALGTPLAGLAEGSLLAVSVYLTSHGVKPR